MCAAQLTCKFHKRDFNGFINGIPIRKVYFAPALPQIAEHIEQYFQGFGVVESISMHTKGRAQFGFVQYKSFEAAKAILSDPWPRVSNKSLTVKPAHELHQPDYMKFKAPEQDSPHHIHNALIDDCLDRVFRQLDLVDLATEADVCVRFQLRAIDAFKSKYKGVVQIDLKSLEYYCDCTDHRFETIFRNFGSLIHSLTIDATFIFGDTIDTLKIIDKYAPAIKHLKLYDFHVGVEFPLFGKLEKLELIECGSAEKPFVTCLELKCLRVGGFLWKDYCIDQTFPKLEEVHLDFYLPLSIAELEKFIASNSTIKKLSIRHIHPSWHSECTDNISVIGQHLKNLEELHIYRDKGYFAADEERFRGLGQLSALKKLILNCNGISLASLLTELVENAVPLEYLSLKVGSADSSAIRSMCKLTKLKEIWLFNIDGLTDDHCIELVEKLPQLRALHLDGSSAEHITVTGLRNMLHHAKTLLRVVLDPATSIRSISMNDFRSMQKSVRDRSEKNEQKIKITGDRCCRIQISISEDFSSANRQRFWIDEEAEKYDNVDYGAYDDENAMHYREFYT